MSGSVFMSPINMNQNEIQNGVFAKLGTAPAGPIKGQFFFLTSNNTAQIYNGTSWIQWGTLDQISAPVGAVGMNSQRITNLANASAATDAMNQQSVLALTVNSFTVPTASFNMNSQKITSLADPVNPQDAATKNYVDLAQQGLSAKAAVNAATTGANITLSGLQTIDGVSLTAGMRVLVKDQTAASQNGIYVVSASAWTRAIDMDASSEFYGAYVLVEYGATTLAGTSWTCTNSPSNNPITIGTTAISFVQFNTAGQANGVNIGTLGQGVYVSKSGNNLQFKNITNGAGLVAPTTDGNNNIVLAVDTTSMHDTQKFAKYFSQDNGSQLSGNLVLTHNLNNQYPHIQIYDKINNTWVTADVTFSSVNALSIVLTGTYVANQYQVVLLG
jgi:hypothetical protein